MICDACQSAFTLEKLAWASAECRDRFIELHPDGYSLLQGIRSGCEVCHLLSRKSEFGMELDIAPQESDKDGAPLPITADVDSDLLLRKKIVMRPTWEDLDLNGSSQLVAIDFYHEEPGQSWRRQWLRAFIPYQMRDAPLKIANYPGRNIAADPLDEANIVMIKEWLDNCFKNHSICPNFSQPMLPLRVIHVGDETSCPRLYCSGGIGSYCALTYCWGTEKFMTLEMGNLKRLVEGFVLEELPKTIRDAILVTRKLGIQFLWVDSLCIMQDSLQDWAVESSKMASIYGHAYLTIASSASSAQSGFLKCRDLDLPHASVEIDSSGQKLWLRRPIGLLEDSPKTLPYTDRAWCLQEILLSPRLLEFGKEQIQFVCQDNSVGEDGFWRKTEGNPGLAGSGTHYWGAMLLGNTTYRVPKQVQPQQPELNERYDAWRDAVEEYCKATLSKQTDRLPALSGLASRFNSSVKDQYYAGIWGRDVLNGLIWRTRGNHRVWSTEPRMGRNAQQFDAKGAQTELPSWSWAAQSWPIAYWHYSVDVSEVMIESIETFPATVDPFGLVGGGRLQIKALYGVLDDANRSKLSHTTAILWMDDRIRWPNGGYLIENIQTPFECIQVGVKRGSRSVPAESYALVLEAAADGASYRRIGLLQGLDCSFGWTETRHLIII